MTADPRSGEIPFWQSKSLEEMTNSEWESLCDGCGRCCLNKLEEVGTDRTFYTDVGCRLLDLVQAASATAVAQALPFRIRHFFQ